LAAPYQDDGEGRRAGEGAELERKRSVHGCLLVGERLTFVKPFWRVTIADEKEIREVLILSKRFEELTGG
jgi:hypothetical protein